MASFNSEINCIREALKKRIDALREKVSDCHINLIAVLDIEGTTTALPFVTKVLFPFAEKEIDRFVIEKYEKFLSGDSDADTTLFGDALRQASTEINGDPTSTLLKGSEFASLLKEKMTANSKVPYLKSIQGVIWRSGYMNGALKGHVFDDVPPFLSKLSPNSNAFEKISTFVEIYSSGSIAAQKLLFNFSTLGNLCPYISGYHDPTTVGLKTSPESYKRLSASLISQKGKENISQIRCFFSDSVDEITACVTSGAFEICIFVMRPLNNPITTVEEDQLSQMGVPKMRSFKQFVEALESLPTQRTATTSKTPSVFDDQKEDEMLSKQVLEFADVEELKTF